MPKVNLPEILSGYLSTEKLNEAFQQIEDAFDNTLSRDGSTPNQLEADLDLNGFSIINASTNLDDPNRLLSYSETVALIAAASSGLLYQQQEDVVLTAGQEVVNFSELSYQLASGNLAVYIDGVRQFSPDDYAETSTTSITLTTPAVGGETLVAITNNYVATVSLPAHTHPWSQITSKPEEATRWPTYAEVTGKPSTFTPSAHVHSTADITSGVGLADARRGVYVQSTQPTAGRAGEIWMW